MLTLVVAPRVSQKKANPGHAAPNDRDGPGHHPIVNDF